MFSSNFWFKLESDKEFSRNWLCVCTSLQGRLNVYWRGEEDKIHDKILWKELIWHMIHYTKCQAVLKFPPLINKRWEYYNLSGEEIDPVSFPSILVWTCILCTVVYHNSKSCLKNTNYFFFLFIILKFLLTILQIFFFLIKSTLHIFLVLLFAWDVSEKSWSSYL